MKTEIINALDELRSWATRQQAILNLANALGDVASIEQLTSESKAALATAQATLGEVNAELKTAQEALATAKSESEILVSNTDAHLQASIAEAEQKAKDIVSAAEVEAAGLLEAVKLSSDKVAEQNEASVQEALATVARIKQSEDDAVAKAVVAAGELQALNEKIAAAKASIAQLLNGNA